MLRTMLLLGCLLTLYLLGVHEPLLLLALTAVTSVVLSYFLLKGPREAMARSLAERAARRLPPEPDGHRPLADADALDEDREAGGGRAG